MVHRFNALLYNAKIFLLPNLKKLRKSDDRTIKLMISLEKLA